MKPIQLSASERPITKIRINRHGDLIFSTGKDGKACAWYTDNGERLGTYEGHKGALFDFDVDSDTNYCLTACSDCNFGIWRALTGEPLRFIAPRDPDRITNVSWATGNKQFSVSTIAKKSANGLIKSHTLIYDFDPEMWEDQSIDDSAFKYRTSCPPDTNGPFTGHGGKIAEVLWGPVNECIITAGEDGTIRKWDTSNGEEIRSTNFDQNASIVITSLSYSKDKTLLVASGKDHTARLFNTESMQCIRIFRSDKPLNCAILHPNLNCLMVAGGQSARDVTTTSHGKGKFEVQFYHTIYGEKIGEIRTGHFSPINYLAIARDGSFWASGAEEGTVRLFKMEADFESKFRRLEKSFLDGTG